MKLPPSSLRKPLAWIVTIAILVLLGLYLTGTFDERIAPPHDGVAGPRPAENSREDSTRFVVTPVEQDVVERAPGTVHAIRETALTSRIVADVREVLVRAGSQVAQGDPLLLLDDRDLQAMVQQTQKQLAGAQARLNEAEATYTRTKTAAEKGAVSGTALDQAEANQLSAESEVARLDQRVEQMRVDLSHATIRAPFDAVITDRYVFPGDLASPERPLMRLYDPHSMRLEAFVRESLAIHLEIGQPVTVELDTLGLVLEGTVEEVVPQAEAASRSFLVKVGLPQTERLYPGMFGRLLLRSGTAQRLLVPENALTHIGQLSYVTLADGSGTRRLVVPGNAASEGRVEILSGVEPGLELVVPR